MSLKTAPSNEPALAAAQWKLARSWPCLSSQLEEDVVLPADVLLHDGVDERIAAVHHQPLCSNAFLRPRLLLRQLLLIP